MEKLKGKTILIGKEPGQGRLLIAIVGGKAAAIGAPGCVPNSVSRCKVAEGMAHAKITVDQDGNMILSNMKEQNVTYVNGSEIASKKISTANTVELGMDHYRVNMPMLVEAARKIAVADSPAPSAAPKSVDISHLEQVWQNYHDSLRKLREEQKKVNLIRSGCGIFTMCAMPCIFFFGPIGYVLTGIGLLGNVYSFIGLKNDNTTDEQEHIMEEFQDSYVCPNCGKFLGNISYKMLKRQIVSAKDQKMRCPLGCGAEFVEG